MQYSYGAQPNSDFISGSEYQPSSLVSLTEFLLRTIFSTISTNLAWYEQLREKTTGKSRKRIEGFDWEYHGISLFGMNWIFMIGIDWNISHVGLTRTT